MKPPSSPLRWRIYRPSHSVSVSRSPTPLSHNPHAPISSEQLPTSSLPVKMVMTDTATETSFPYYGYARDDTSAPGIKSASLIFHTNPARLWPINLYRPPASYSPFATATTSSASTHIRCSVRLLPLRT